MIKIKLIDGRTATTNNKGGWSSDDKLLEEGLNLMASSDEIREYTPDIEASMLELAKRYYRGLEVLEKTTKKEKNVPKNAVF